MNFPSNSSVGRNSFNTFDLNNLTLENNVYKLLFKINEYEGTPFCNNKTLVNILENKISLYIKVFQNDYHF